MRSSIVVGAAIALALIAGAYSLRCDGGVEPPRADAPAARADAVLPHAADDATSRPAERNEVQAASSSLALTAAHDATGPTLRVRLLGLDDEAPWTSAVSLDIYGEDETGREVDDSVEARPDAEGRMSFAVPDWAVTRMTNGRLWASDPRYLRLRQSWNGGQDVGEEMLVRVFAQATVTGRVVDEQDKPVRAQVTADVPRDAVRSDANNRTTYTRADGTWSLTVPASARLKVAAHATNASDRASLLEADAVVQARAAATTTVPDLVLARGSLVTGSVRWIDGEPLAGVLVWLRRVDGEVTSHAGYTDGQGRFELPAAPGRPVDVLMATFVPDIESRRTVPGQGVEFRLPRPVVVRARRGGNDVDDAQIELGAHAILEHDSHGSRRWVVAPTREIRARATAGRWRSAWRTIGPADAGKTIDLELVAALTEVAIHLDSEVAVLAAESRWRRPDGREDRDFLSRPASDQPFSTFVEPGRYHVTVEATRDDNARKRGDVFLLPVECDVDVDVAGEQTAVHLAAVFGGRLELAATDADGAPIAARCVIAGNRACAVQAVELKAAGATTWSGALPSGTYNLHFELAGHGKRQRTVTIEPRKLARVCVRL